MPKTTKTKSRKRRPLTLAEAAAEQTRLALIRSINRARAIKRLSKQLQRLNDEAQRELFNMADHIADRQGYDVMSRDALKAAGE